jgi:hypothetical protein
MRIVDWNVATAAAATVEKRPVWQKGRALFRGASHRGDEENYQLFAR